MQDHRLVQIGRDLERSLVPPPAQIRLGHEVRLWCSVSFVWILKANKDGNSTTSLGNLCHCQPILRRHVSLSSAWTYVVSTNAVIFCPSMRHCWEEPAPLLLIPSQWSLWCCKGFQSPSAPCQAIPSPTAYLPRAMFQLTVLVASSDPCQFVDTSPTRALK